jgi:hypothetical protein
MRIERPSGTRWELALSILEDGRDVVEVENVALRRSVGFPNSDGLVHIDVRAAFAPESSSQERALRDLASARHNVETL